MSSIISPLIQKAAVFIVSLVCLSSAVADDANDNLKKIHFVQQHFDQQSGHTELWQNGWFGLFASVATLQGIAYSQTENEPRLTDRKVGFTTSFLGAADLLLNPMKTHRYAQQLRDMPEDTPQQQQRKASQAQAWLEAVAEREAYEQSWVNHLLSGVVNGLAGAVVANEGNRTAQGVATFVSGMVASELKIYTAPQQSVGALQRLRQGDYRSAAKPVPRRWQFAASGPVLLAQYRF